MKISVSHDTYVMSLEYGVGGNCSRLTLGKTAIVLYLLGTIYQRNQKSRHPHREKDAKLNSQHKTHDYLINVIFRMYNLPSTSSWAM